jgi:hypothetical protein
MQKSDLKEFVKIMYGLADNFGAELSEPGLHMRFEALKGYSLEDVRNAALSIIRTRKYSKMPTVAELLEHLEGGQVEDRARVEASKVLEAMRLYGAYQSVVFDDPVTIAVVDQAFGGWVKLNQELKSHDEKWFIKDFCNAYSSYSRQGIKSFDTLLGVIGSTNRSLGYDHVPAPVLVGDRGKAQEIKRLKAQERVKSLFSATGNFFNPGH